MFHPPIITTWKDRFTLKILGFLRVPCRNMAQGKLATSPLSISPFSIPYCQEPHTQGCNHLHSQAQAPSHTLLPTNRYPQATPLGLGVCTPVASLPSEGQTRGKTHTDSGKKPGATGSRNSQILGIQSLSRMEGFGL